MELKTSIDDIDEDAKIAIVLIANKFLRADDNKLNFPSSFNSKERKFAHKVCNYLGLKSKTLGKGPNKSVLCVKDENILLLEEPKLFHISEDSLHLLSNFMLNYPFGHKERLDLLLRTEKFGNPPPDDVERNKVVGRINIGLALIPNCSNNFILTKNQLLIINAPLQTGKYDIPKSILEHSKINKKPTRVIIIQNYKLTVINSAINLTSFLNEKVGQTVGYQVRLESKVSPTTIITYCTPWVFLRNLISSDPELTRLTHIIIDNVNDRLKFIDIMLIYFKFCLLPKHKNTKVILMTSPSNNLPKNLLQYFQNANISSQIIEIENPAPDIAIKKYYLEDTLKFIYDADNKDDDKYDSEFKIYLLNQRTSVIRKFNEFLRLPNDIATEPNFDCLSLKKFIEILSIIATGANNNDLSHHDFYKTALDEALEEIWLIEWYLVKKAEELENLRDCSSPGGGIDELIASESHVSDASLNTKNNCKIRNPYFDRCGQYASQFIEATIRYQFDVTDMVHSIFDFNILMICAGVGLNECLEKIFEYLVKHSTPSINNNNITVAAAADSSRSYGQVNGINRFCKHNGWIARDWALHYNRHYTVTLLDTFYEMADLRSFEEAELIFQKSLRCLPHEFLDDGGAEAEEDLLSNTNTLSFYYKLHSPPPHPPPSSGLPYTSEYQEVLLTLLLKLLTLDSSIVTCPTRDNHPKPMTEVVEDRKPVEKQSSSFSNALVFLPSFDEISRFKEFLLHDIRFSHHLSANTARIFVVYSDMHPSDLKQIYDNDNSCSRIILATEIAENSVYIPNVHYVIDSGLIEEEFFDPFKNDSFRKLWWISREKVSYRQNCLSASFRAADVKEELSAVSPSYFALYSKVRYDTGMAENSIPEFYRADLSEALLQAKYLIPLNSSLQEFLAKGLPSGCPNEHNLKPNFVSRLRCMIQNLKNIDILDDCLDLTELGQHCLDIPLHPKWAKMIMHALVLKCLDPVLTLVSTLAGSKLHCGGTGPYLSNSRLILGNFPPDIKSSPRIHDTDLLIKNKLNGFRADKSAFSDHMAIIRIFQNWQRSRLEGREDAFCYVNNLSPVKLEAIFTFRSHVLGQLRACGLIKSNQASQQLSLTSPTTQSTTFNFANINIANGKGTSMGSSNKNVHYSYSFGDIRDCNSHSDSWPTVKACLTLGLYPNIVKIIETTSSGVKENSCSMFLSCPCSTFYTNSSINHQIPSSAVSTSSHHKPLLVVNNSNVVVAEETHDFSSNHNNNNQGNSNKLNMKSIANISTPPGSSNSSSSSPPLAAKKEKNLNVGLDPRVCLCPTNIPINLLTNMPPHNPLAVNDQRESGDYNNNNNNNGQASSLKQRYPSDWIVFDRYHPIRHLQDKDGTVADFKLPYGGYVSGCTFVTPINIILFAGSNRTPKEYIQDIENPDSLQNMANLILQEESDSENEELSGQDEAGRITKQLKQPISAAASAAASNRRIKGLSYFELKLDDRLIFQQSVDTVRLLLHLRQKYHALSIKRFKHPSKPWSSSDEVVLQTVVALLNQEETFMGFNIPTGIGQRPKPMPTELNNTMLINVSTTTPLINTDLKNHTAPSYIQNSSENVFAQNLSLPPYRKNDFHPITNATEVDDFNNKYILSGSCYTQRLNNNNHPNNKQPPFSAPLLTPFSLHNQVTGGTIINTSNTPASFRYALLKVYSEDSCSSSLLSQQFGASSAGTEPNTLSHHHQISQQSTLSSSFDFGKIKPPKMGNPDEFCNYPQLAADAKQTMEKLSAQVLCNIMLNFIPPPNQPIHFICFVLNSRTKIFMGILKVKFWPKSIPMRSAGREDLSSSSSYVRVDEVDWILKKLVNIERIISSSNTLTSKLLTDWKNSELSVPIMEIDEQFAAMIFKYFDNPSYKQYAGNI